jgi:hypothetical protein
MIFTYVLTIYLSWIYPSIILLFLPPTFLEQFHRFHSPIFIYGYKTHPPYSLSFPLSLYPASPTGTHPKKRFIFLPALHVFN